MEIGEILTKSWKIIWKHKVLWLFGLLASCGQSNGGGGGGGGGSSNFDLPKGSENNFNIPGAEQFFRQMDRTLQADNAWLIIAAVVLGLICLGFILSLLFTAIGTMGRIGLIRGACLADGGAESLSFGQIWAESKPYFWRVFLLTLLLGLLGLVVGFLLLVPILLVTVLTLGCGLLLLIPILILVSWFVTVLIEQTIAAIVVENRSISDGLSRAWAVIRARPGPTAVVSLILLLGSALVGLLFALPLLLLIIPAVVAVAIDSRALVTAGLVTIGGLLLCLIPIAIVFNAGLQAYLGTAWTLVFRRLAGITTGEDAPGAKVETLPA